MGSSEIKMNRFITKLNHCFQEVIQYQGDAVISRVSTGP